VDIVKHFFHISGSTFSDRSKKGFRSGAPESRFPDFSVVRNYLEYDPLRLIKKILQILYNIVKKRKKSNRLSPGFTEIQVVFHGG
jgi:hypothetical protein